MHRGGDRADRTVDGQQVVHLERGTPDRTHAGVDLDHFLELRRPSVLHEHLEHRELVALVADGRIGASQRAEVGDPRLLEPGDVGGMVGDAHGVGLGESHTDGVGEEVVRGDDGEIEVDPHFATSGRCCRPGAVSSTTIGSVCVTHGS